MAQNKDDLKLTPNVPQVLNFPFGSIPKWSGTGRDEKPRHSWSVKDDQGKEYTWFGSDLIKRYLEMADVTPEDWLRFTHQIDSSGNHSWEVLIYNNDQDQWEVVPDPGQGSGGGVPPAGAPAEPTRNAPLPRQQAPAEPQQGVPAATPERMGQLGEKLLEDMADALLRSKLDALRVNKAFWAKLDEREQKGLSGTFWDSVGTDARTLFIERMKRIKSKAQPTKPAAALSQAPPPPDEPQQGGEGAWESNAGSRTPTTGGGNTITEEGKQLYGDDDLPF